jgi:hypothetical protein
VARHARLPSFPCASKAGEMIETEAYTVQMLTTLNEWSAGFGELQAKMAGASAAQKAPVAAALTKLRQQQKDYQAQMAKVRDAGEDAFVHLRRGAERMVREYHKAYERAASHVAS